MKLSNSSKTLVAFFLIITMMISGLSITAVAEGSKTRFTLDDFTVNWGQWGLSNNVFTESENAAHCSLYTKNADYENYTAEASITINDTNANRGAGLLGRTQGRTNGYYFWSHKDELKISKFTSGSENVLSGKKYTFEIGRTYKMKIVLQNETLELYVDGQLELTAGDSSYSKGSFGMVSHYSGGTTFADVSLSMYDPSQDINYTENFENFDSTSWSRFGGTWDVITDPYNSQNKVYTQTDSSAQRVKSLVGESQWKDYNASVKVCIGQELSGGGVGLIANASNDGKNFYLFYYYANTGMLRIARYENNNEAAILKNTSFSMTSGQWYTFSYTVKDAHLEFRVDNSERNLEKFSCVDSNYTNGKFGLFTNWVGCAYFDDVNINTWESMNVGTDFAVSTKTNQQVNGSVSNVINTKPGSVYELSANAKNGVASVAGNGDWSYRPNSDFYGMDRFEIVGESNDSTPVLFSVNVMVLPSNEQLDSITTSQHPRVMINQNDVARMKDLVNTDQTAGSWYNSIISEADRVLTLPVCTYDLSYGELLSVSREEVKRMKSLGLAYLLTNDEKYAERAAADLVSAAGFPDWVPNHLIDTGEMATAFAIGYDWFYDYLAKENKLATVRDAIISHALIPAVYGYSHVEYNGIDIYSQMCDNLSNYNFVNNGGFGMAALAIYGDDQTDYAYETIVGALRCLPNNFLNISVDGGYNEGPTYFVYGIKYLTMFISALDSSTSQNFGMSDYPGFSRLGYYIIRMTGPTNIYDISDTTLNELLETSFMLWHSKKYDNPDYSWYRKSNMGKNPTSGVEALDLIYYDPNLYSEGNNPPENTDGYFSKTEIATFRNSFDSKDTNAISFFAGDNNDNHGDLDIGHFILDSMGERFATDLGRDDYGRPNYFEKGAFGRRWEYYRKRAEGHNTIVINPSELPDQYALANAKITDYKSTETEAYAITDMTCAYKDNADSVKRGVAMVNNRSQFIIQDEFINKSNYPVWWFMHTKAQINVAPDGKSATLELNGKKMHAQILEPSDATFTVRNAEPLPTSPNPQQGSNNGVNVLTIQLNSVKNGQIAVWLAPYSGSEAPTNAPLVTPLSCWNKSVVLSEDHFEPAGKWTTSGGKWSVEGSLDNGIYHQSAILDEDGASRASSFTGKSNWKNYAVSSKVNMNEFAEGGYAGAGLIARAIDKNNCYIFYYYERNHSLRISKYENGAETILTDKSFTINTGIWNDFIAVVNNNELEFYVNGKKELYCKDDTFSEGKVGYYAHRTDCLFDDLAVTASVDYSCMEFYDDFEAYENNNWNTQGGDWRILDIKGNKVYQQSSSDINVASFTEKTFADYQATARIKIVSMDDEGYCGTGFFARATDKSNGYRFYYYEHEKTLRISKYVNGTETILCGCPFNAEPDRWYNFDLSLRGNMLNISVDGKEMLSVEDETYQSGKVGLYTHRTVAQFDDIAISLLEQPVKVDFVDDFEETEAAEWEKIGGNGNWVVMNSPDDTENKVYHQTDDCSLAKIFVGNENWQNYTASVKVCISKELSAGSVGLIANASDDGKNYYLFYYYPESGQLRVAKYTNDSQSVVLSNTALHLDAGEWYTFNYSAIEGHLEFWVNRDNETLARIQCADISYSGGKFGLFTNWVDCAYFDDVSVYSDVLYGDVNGDNFVNTVDAMLALKHTVNIITLSGDNFKRADVYVNGKVNTLDALYILQYSLDIREYLPVFPSKR